MKKTEKIKAISYKNGLNKEVDEEIVSDETINLNINNTIQRSLSGLEDSLKEFITGYLIGEDMINSIDEIKDIKINGPNIYAEVESSKLNEGETVLCSDSAGGWRKKIETIKPVKSNLIIPKEDILNNMERLRENAITWQATGGTHVAAIVYEDKFIVKEDVSRHVAVDKVIGAGAYEGFDFSKSYIVYSGRMPADMVIKVVRAGIPILVSNASPAFSGYTTAKKGNITLVGFVRGNRFNVYANTNRISFD